MTAIQNIAVNTHCLAENTACEAAMRLFDVGFRRFEIPASDGFRCIDELDGFFSSSGAECVSINTFRDMMPIYLGNLCTPNKKERARASEFLMRSIDMAVRFGAKLFICDAGTTVEDFKTNTNLNAQMELFAEAFDTILAEAESANLVTALSPVPGRRWLATESYPPDIAPVVERHVWPWREWLTSRYLIETTFPGRVKWVFDTADAVVASGCSPKSLSEEAEPFISGGLAAMHLANHPGPYNKVWHRLHLHHRPEDGWWMQDDFKNLYARVQSAEPESILLVREKGLSPEDVRYSAEFLAD